MGVAIISILRKISLSKDTATETDTPDSLSNPTNHNASRNEARANTLRDTSEHSNTPTTPNSTTAYGYQDRVCGGADSTGIHQGQVVGEVSEATEGHMGAVDPDIQELGRVVRLPACVRIHFHMFLGRMLLLTAAPPVVVLDVREFREMLCSLCACDKRCMSRADVQTHTHTNTQTHTHTHTHTHPRTRTHHVGALQTYGDNEDENPVDISAGDNSGKNSVALSNGLSPDTELLPAPTATTGQPGGPGDCEPYTDAESVAATLDERQDIVMQLYAMGWCHSARVSDTQLLQWLVGGGLWQVAEVVYIQMGDLDKYHARYDNETNGGL
ncbi:hypothetical protein SARC_05845 [Sphaeroforma arctica JP610]|uniref:Uncharacterized protein n=1 Tax=Sphaeroforma arctica JP610 TaxID=667725 RepID=A0A0L0FZ57_9EUKA|nr:hypothetical protein SARC_05845 [Sphaeroforma arctica JP610]KNC81856.1 hypothetical protein SARC_05845 [Sphaeroforma arctica JP610]|eukprot:XP_014155758.1 hypothetical protein SARC_05845 [Sphaeroforma arctica JP610]